MLNLTRQQGSFWANLLRHDPAAGAGGDIALYLKPHGADGLRAQIIDPGQAFDVTKAKVRPDRAPGGHGLLIIRELAESLSYKRQGGKNCLEFTINPDR